MEFSSLLTFALACVVLFLIPGPGMMFILTSGMARGPRAGAVAALGMATGTVVHTLATAFGLSALLRAAPLALDAVRVAGAVFLVYLAITMLRAARTTVTDTVQSGRSLRRTYGMAVLTNLANPKVVLFYLAFLPQFLTEGGWPVWTQLLTLGLILTVLGLIMDVAIGLLAGTLSRLLMARPAIRRWLNRAAAAIFGGLAVRLVVDSR